MLYPLLLVHNTSLDLKLYLNFFFFSKRKNYFLPFKAEQNINFVEIHLKMSFFFSMIFFTILDVEKFHSGAILSEKI